MSSEDASSEAALVAIAEMKSAHEENINSAQALLETIERVKAKQERWQVVLSEAMAQDREEEMTCERVFKRVALSQMQMATHGADAHGLTDFEIWLDSKGARIGSSKIQSWFHDDLLVTATPFCAILPFPRNLTDAGKKSLTDEVSGLGITGEFFVENFPFSKTTLLKSAAALGILGSSIAQSQGPLEIVSGVERSSTGELSTTKDHTARYLQMACLDGPGLLELIDDHQCLQDALKESPCLFLNDAGASHGTCTALRRRGLLEHHVCALLRCIVIRGDLIAAEGVSSLYNQKSSAKPFDSPAFGDHLANFVRSLTGPTSCLHDRSSQLIMTAHFNGDPTSADSIADVISNSANPFTFFLLDVSLFEGTSTDHFNLSELLLLAEYRSALRAEKGNAPESKLVVRMAGSPWPEVNSAIARRVANTVSEPSGSQTSDKIAVESEIHTDLVGNAESGSLAGDEDTKDHPNAEDGTPSINVKNEGDRAGLSMGTVSLLMAGSAALAVGATVALSAIKKAK